MELIDYKKTKIVAIWLYICCFTVFCMAIIGAITRLTDSGLSMVEWRPLMGALPPMHEDEWNRVFNIYKETPQFQEINSDMLLPEFKKIFFWEWIHRLWGRMIGVIYVVPFLLFLSIKRIPSVYLPSFFGFLIIGCGQGLMGWYMVKSGLVDMPEVSHYRLAAHLGLALLLQALLFNMALKLSVQPSREYALLSPLYKPIRRSMFLVSLTLFWGVMVAGLDAGMIYNSFPMMGKYPWPEEALDMMPLWSNFFENHATVQFCHRVLAILTAISVLSLVIQSFNFQKNSRLSKLFKALAIVVILQVGLGVMTLLTKIDIYLAVMHQGGAMVLLALLIWAWHEVPHTNYSLDK